MPVITAGERSTRKNLWLVLRPLYQNVLPLVCEEGKLIGEVFQNLDLIKIAFDEFLKSKIDAKPLINVLESSERSQCLSSETAANTPPKVATNTAVVSKLPPEDPSNKFLSQKRK